MIDIFTLNSIGEEKIYEDLVSQVQFIFYASSSLKDFSSPERKQSFFKRWCGDYMTLYPDQFFIMKEGNKVLGYLSGCSDSLAALSVVEVPGFSLFKDLFLKYPAHFHINFHPECRGRGLGGQLANNFCNSLKVKGINGLHLVTSPDALNISFYRRLGFNVEVKREFNQKDLLFMGKEL